METGLISRGKVESHEAADRSQRNTGEYIVWEPEKCRRVHSLGLGAA